MIKKEDLKIGQIIWIRSGYSWGRSSREPNGPCRVKILTLDGFREHPSSFRATSLTSGVDWYYKLDEICEEPKPCERGILIGERLVQT